MEMKYLKNGTIIIYIGENYKPAYNTLHDIVINDYFGSIDWIPIERYENCDTQLIYNDKTQRFYYLIGWCATLSLLNDGHLILIPTESKKWMYETLVKNWDFQYFEETNTLFAPWDLPF